ncbi:MAG TPA: hypothetical protein VM223_05920 [Planctomycetota bacterium]|nr:hypothetical protein [Planctomycetota bacterium]
MPTVEAEVETTPMPEAVLQGRVGSGLGKFAGTELADTMESKDVSEVMTVADQKGQGWAKDHLPAALRVGNLPTPPVSRDELSLEPEIFVWLKGALDPNEGDFAMSIPARQRVPNGTGGWTVLPARTIAFPRPGCRYTTPDLAELEDLQYGFFRGQGKKETVARKSAHEAAVEELRDLKWCIWNSAEGRSKEIVPLAVAQAPKPQQLKAHWDALVAAGVDLDKFSEWQASLAAKADAKPKE